MERKLYIIKENDLNFLKKNIENVGLLKEINKIFLNKMSKQKASSISIFFSKVQVKILLDELTNLFSSIGIQTNSEPNEIGYHIEDLIDIFSNYKD